MGQADVAQVTCIVDGCANAPAKSRRGMCAKHYRDSWKQSHSCSVEGCKRSYLGSGYCGLHYKRARGGVGFDVPALGSGKEAGCAVEGCDRSYHGDGYCGLHLQRLRRTGDPLGVKRLTRDLCTIDGCTDPHVGLGYCARHYKRRLRWGNAEPVFYCRACGTEFDYDNARSYFYCDECHEHLPAGYRMKRLERLALNNAGMTADDWQMTRDYIAVIRTDPCMYCGAPSGAIDHIQPVVNGGSDRWDNLAPVCKRCNSVKRDKSVLVMLLTAADRHEYRGDHQAA